MMALEIAGVSHTYRRKALDAVSFAVTPGEFVVLLGLNGAGKTTLFSLIAGLLPLQAGTLRVLGHPLPRERTQALAGCGFVFQQPALDLDLTVSQTLRYHAALHGLSRRDAQRRRSGGRRWRTASANRAAFIITAFTLCGAKGSLAIRINFFAYPVTQCR